MQPVLRKYIMQHKANLLSFMIHKQKFVFEKCGLKASRKKISFQLISRPTDYHCTFFTLLHYHNIKKNAKYLLENSNY